MTITYNWVVTQMDAYPHAYGEYDVVFNVHWTLFGTDGQYSGVLYSATHVQNDPAEPFVPYTDLTQEQVLGWVQDALGPEGIAEAEANVAKQIEDQANPPYVTPPLPWAPSLS